MSRADESFVKSLALQLGLARAITESYYEKFSYDMSLCDRIHRVTYVWDGTNAKADISLVADRKMLRQ